MQSVVVPLNNQNQNINPSFKYSVADTAPDSPIKHDDFFDDDDDEDGIDLAGMEATHASKKKQRTQ